MTPPPKNEHVIRSKVVGDHRILFVRQVGGPTVYRITADRVHEFSTFEAAAEWARTYTLPAVDRLRAMLRL